MTTKLVNALNSIKQRLVIAIPFSWFIVFLALPFLVVLKISLAQQQLASPPFTPLLYWADQVVQIKLSLANYLYILTHTTFATILLSSIKIAFITTILAIVVGYPLTYAIVLSSPRLRSILFTLIILPYWTSFLLRAYAWVVILQNNGLVNKLLQTIGITHEPVRLLYTNFSIYVGLLYGYLPFFILPLYATLIKFNPRYLEAAFDLGCRPIRAFITITLPLTWQGIMAGAFLVFIPCIGEVVIPQVLGGIHTLMIGNVIWQEFFVANDWPLAAALAVVILLLLVAPVVWFQKLQQRAKWQHE